MKRGLATILVLGVVGVAALAGSASAEARTSYCTTRIQHDLYSVAAQGLSCKLAKRWTERYIRHGTEPAGWNCGSGGCADRHSNASFTWFRPTHDRRAGTKWQNCGDGYPNYNFWGLKANGISCSGARKAAVKHFKTGDKRFHGWYCKDRKKFESYKTRCHRGRKGSYQALKYQSGV